MSGVLTESLEDYLLDIFLIGMKKKVVRLKDIAQSRKVSLPSVTNAIRVLSSKGLVNHEEYGHVELTDAGIEEAKRVYERHKTIYKFLHNILGIDEELAESEAHKMEHDLHEKTLMLLQKFTEFVEKSPVKENPLWLEHFRYFVDTGEFPECKHTKGGEPRMKLSEMKVGENARVISIQAKGTLKRRLLDMGIIPGTTVKVEKKAPLGDPIDIVVKHYHLSLRKDEASSITVEGI